MHVHSTWSYDGKWELPKLANAFASRGYNVALMTEHDLGFNEERRRAHRDACRAASTDQLLVLPGIEYSDPSNTIHILVWGDVPFLGAGQDTQRMLERAAEHGGVCVMAHPSRRAAWQKFQMEWLKFLAGIEVWNRKTDGWSPSKDARKLILQTGASPVVGLDFHSARQFFPLTVCLNVEGKAEEAKILDALRRHSYHCEAFGVDVKTFMDGFGLSATSVLEAGRRFAASAVRRATALSRRKTAQSASESREHDSNASDQSIQGKGIHS